MNDLERAMIDLIFAIVRAVYILIRRALYILIRRALYILIR